MLTFFWQSSPDYMFTSCLSMNFSGNFVKINSWFMKNSDKFPILSQQMNSNQLIIWN